MYLCVFCVPVSQLRRGCGKGHCNCQVQPGSRCEDGNGVAQNLQLAMGLYFFKLQGRSYFGSGQGCARAVCTGPDPAARSVWSGARAGGGVQVATGNCEAGAREGAGETTLETMVVVVVVVVVVVGMMMMMGMGPA
eukprot:1451483-Rhodomonas_salina.2